MKYSNERKEAVLRQLEAPNGPTIQELSKKERISVSTLGKWRSEARNGGKPMPNSKGGQEIWSSQDKFRSQQRGISGQATLRNCA